MFLTASTEQPKVVAPSSTERPRAQGSSHRRLRAALDAFLDGPAQSRQSGRPKKCDRYGSAKKTSRDRPWALQKESVSLAWTDAHLQRHGVSKRQGGSNQSCLTRSPAVSTPAPWLWLRLWLWQATIYQHPRPQHLLTFLASTPVSRPLALLVHYHRIF